MNEPLLHLTPDSLRIISAALAESTNIVTVGASLTVGVTGLPGSATHIAAADLAASWSDRLRERAATVQRYSDLAASQASSLPAADTDIGLAFSTSDGPR